MLNAKIISRLFTHWSSQTLGKFTNLDQTYAIDYKRWVSLTYDPWA